MGTLHDLMNKASRMAEAMFDPDDVLTPHFVAEAADGSISLIALGAGGADLDRLRVSMPRMLEGKGFRRWVFFGEAFCADYEARSVQVTVQPVDRPDRLEVILLEGFEVAGRQDCRGSRQILRLDGDIRVMPLVIEAGPTAHFPSVGVAGGRP